MGPSKQELLTRMRFARAEWDRLLEAIPPDRMTTPVINDGWSIKDTVGHVTYYEHWLLDWLEDAVRGRVTVACHRDTLPVDERNAIIFAENKDRALHSVLAESSQVFQRLVTLVGLLPEQDLLDEHRYERYIIPFWERSQPLWQCIAGDSHLHYEEHANSVRAWLQREAAQQDSYPSHTPERAEANVSSSGRPIQIYP